MYKIRRSDVILIAATVTLALLGLLLVFLFRVDGAYCVVTQNGAVIGQYALSETRDITFETADGGYNTVHIENGGVRVSGASCPDKICVKTREARYHGDTLVCLPNGFLVTVYGAEGDVDIIV